VKRLLWNCDQVFDVLTRGPFPTGEPEDESVEHHLRACYECRRLAEALRPAVALLHEAVAADQAIDLPEYQGSLPDTGGERRRLSMAQLATHANQSPPAFRLASNQQVERRQPQAVSAVRFIAASLLIASLGLLFGGTLISPRGLDRLARWPAVLLPAPANPTFSEPAPDVEGLVTLASLKLPTTCLPQSHRPISAQHAAEIMAAVANGSLEGLRCCTECHRAGLSQPKAAQLVAINQQNCQACHRG